MFNVRLSKLVSDAFIILFIFMGLPVSWRIRLKLAVFEYRLAVPSLVQLFHSETVCCLVPSVAYWLLFAALRVS
jgi:hypothetical protein